jgi:hypothetical protein
MSEKACPTNRTSPSLAGFPSRLTRSSTWLAAWPDSSLAWPSAPPVISTAVSRTASQRALISSRYGSLSIIACHGRRVTWRGGPP